MVQKLTVPAQINQILAWQWLITLCIAVSLLVIKRELALSALLGGITCALPNMYFARQLFTKRRIAQAALLIRNIYVAEFIKLGLTVTLMAIVLINYKGIHPASFFITYLIAYSCMWAVPLLTKSSRNTTFRQTH